MKMLLVFATRDFVMQQHREELGVSELPIDCLTVAPLERVGDAGQAELFNDGIQFSTRIHGVNGSAGIGEHGRNGRRSGKRQSGPTRDAARVRCPSPSRGCP